MNGRRRWIPAAIVAALVLGSAAQLHGQSSGSGGDASFAGVAPLSVEDKSLDMNDLADRISDTKAIGLLTKLSLKKDVNKLEKDLRDFHGGKGKSTLDQLHERYDLMVHDILVLVQDKDKELAKDIARARDPLWARLADPYDFARTVG